MKSKDFELAGLGRRGLLRLAVGTALLPLVGTAAQAALTPADQADIARIEEYMNGIRSLSADFVQIGPNGELSRGKFYLRRPGRLRFEYDPPVPLLIVADGLWLVVYDKELEQVTRLPLYETPLGVLAAEKVSLSEDVEVTRVDRQAGILRVQLIDRDRPDEGWLSLAFSEPPLELRQWHVRDAQGGVTNVALSDMRTGVKLDPKLFVFNDPAPFRE
jgi:outer membrane lipoprotein-sorting protein